MEWDWIAKANELKLSGEEFVIATVIGEKGSTPRNSGAKIIVTNHGELFGTIGGGQLEMHVRNDALKFLEEARSASTQYPLCLRAGQCCGGASEVFFEIVGLRPKLFLFGGGHVGQALLQTLDGTPFELHLIEQRREWVDHPLLPERVRKHSAHWKEVLPQLTWDPQRSYFVVMTHDHHLDLEIVNEISQRKARWIGLIGSEHKRDRFEHRLKQMARSEDEIARIVCPIGDHKLGKAPKEVAISAAAQLLRILYDA